MNILSQLLPGVREFRTPVAAGALWILAIVTSSHLLPASAIAKLGHLTDTLYGYVSFLPAAVLISAASLGVYLLGMVATLAGENIARAMHIFSKPAVTIIPFGVLFFVALLFDSPGGFFLLTLFPLGLFSLGVWLLWRKKRQSSYLDYYLDRLRSAAAVLPDALAAAAKFIESAWNPSRKEIDYFVTQDLIRRTDASPELVKALVTGMAEWAKVSLLDGEVAFSLEGAPVLSPESWSDWRQLAHALQPWSSAEQLRVTDDLSRWFTEKATDLLLADHELRLHFLRRYTRVAAYSRDVERRLQAARVRLKIDQPGLYDEYDRIRAECEFRYGVALPISVVAVSLWFIASRELSLLKMTFDFDLGETGKRYTSWEPRYLVAIILFLVLIRVFYSAGKAKETEALSLLYSSVRQAVITPVTDANFMARDLRVGPRTWRALIDELLEN